MKKILSVLLCAAMLLVFAGCEKYVSVDDETPNDLPDDIEDIGSIDEIIGNIDEGSGEYIEEELLELQGIIGVWVAQSIYQSPRNSDGTFDSDEAALEYATENAINVSYFDFSSAAFVTVNPVYEQELIELDELENAGIQVDETLVSLAGDSGKATCLTVKEDGSDEPGFTGYVFNDSYMLYAGEGGYVFIAEKLEAEG